MGAYEALLHSPFLSPFTQFAVGSSGTVLVACPCSRLVSARIKASYIRTRITHIPSPDLLTKSMGFLSHFVSE